MTKTEEGRKGGSRVAIEGGRTSSMKRWVRAENMDFGASSVIRTYLGCERMCWLRKIRASCECRKAKQCGSKYSSDLFGLVTS